MPVAGAVMLLEGTGMPELTGRAGVIVGMIVTVLVVTPEVTMFEKVETS